MAPERPPGPAASEDNRERSAARSKGGAVTRNVEVEVQAGGVAGEGVFQRGLPLLGKRRETGLREHPFLRVVAMLGINPGRVVVAVGKALRRQTRAERRKRAG